MTINSKLSPDLIEILKQVTSTFNRENILYWLGGGLYQLLLLNRYDEITKNWRNHDIDFHVWHKDQQKCLELLREVGFSAKFYSTQKRHNKIAFTHKGISVETPFLFESEDDSNVVYFISWGKKENWPLGQNERKLFYYFSLPKFTFTRPKYFNIGNFNVRVPLEQYVYLLYNLTPEEIESVESNVKQ